MRGEPQAETLPVTLHAGPDTGNAAHSPRSGRDPERGCCYSPTRTPGRSSRRGLSNSELLCSDLLAHAGNHPAPANLSLLEHSRKGETGLLFPRPEQTARKAYLNLKTNPTITTWLGDHTEGHHHLRGESSRAGGPPSAPLQPPAPKPERRTKALELPSQATSKFPWESENLLRRQRAIESLHPFSGLENRKWA